MQWIDADKAHPGTTIVAAYQHAGRGQRGNTWTAKPGESLMMSVITVPGFRIDEQFIFSALVATTIATVIQELDATINVQIKWPNDVMINDKKAGGILIESVLRGHSWLYAVIGFGLNVLQDDFGGALPHATSLKIAAQKAFDVKELMLQVRAALISNICNPEPQEVILKKYNDLLFRKNAAQAFYKADKEWVGLVTQVLPNGMLEVILDDGETVHYTHGEVQWKY